VIFLLWYRNKPLILLILTVLIISALPLNALAYTDTDSHWAAGPISKWASKGLVSGYSDGTFLPDKQITRAEFIVLVNRSLVKEGSRQILFKDVLETDWFYKDLSSATYVDGYPDGTFRPNKPITRQEAAVIIAKLVDFPEVDDSALSKFADASSISSWAVDSIKALVTNKVINGYPDGTFKPQKTITRAEAIVTLDNVLQLIEDTQFTGISGVIYESTSVDNPVDNVILKLYPKGSNEPISQTVTNEAGEYKFEVYSGTYDITAEKDGYLGYEEDLIVEEGKTTIKSFAIAKGVKVIGVLKNSQGVLLPNTKLVFKTDSVFQSSTNSDGEFSVYLLPNRDYQVFSIDLKNEDEGYKRSGKFSLGDKDKDVGILRASYPSSSSGSGGGSSTPIRDTVGKPSANPNGGAVIFGSELTLMTTTQNSSIRYTFGDGSQESPTANTGEIYDANNKPKLNSSGVYKVIAFKSGMNSSEELTLSFTVLKSVTGTAFDSEDNLLVNTSLTFTSEGDIHTVETDSSGYFATHISASATYQITGEGLSVSLISNPEGFELTNNQGKILLGKILTIGENKTVYNPSANYLHEDLAPKIFYDESTGRVTFSEQMDFLVGDIIVLPPTQNYPGGMALKIVDITIQGENMVVDTISPEFKEIFSSIKGTTSELLSPEYFVPAEGVEIITEEEPMDVMSIMTSNFQASQLKPVTSLKLGYENGGYKITGQLDLEGAVNGDIDWAIEWDLVDSFYFDVQLRQVLSVKGEYNHLEEDEVKVQIGTYHIPTSIPGVTVVVPVELVFIPEGKITVQIGATFNEQVGVRYDDDNGIRIYPEDKFQADFTELEVAVAGGCKLGVRLPNALAAAGKRIAGVQLESGGYIELSSTPTASLCATLDYGIYGEAKLTLNIIDWLSPAIEQKIEIGSKTIGNCDIDDIRIIPTYLELSPGEIKTFTIQARDSNDEWVNLTDDQYAQLTFSSSNPDVTHLGNGEIKASSNAESSTSTVTFGLSSFTKTATVKIVTESGELQGVVKDAVTNQPIEGVSVTLFEGNLNVNRTTTTSSTGQYNIQAPIGDTYRVIIEKDGYQAEIYENIKIIPNACTYLETVLQISDSYIGNGTVKGKVVSALDGYGVPNITLELRKGINVKNGNIVATATTDANGDYIITDLESGNYTAQISGAGYNTTYLTIICLGGTTRVGQNATISPILSEGETRIVLTWGATPSDLDSHLTGPDGSGGRFHIYYGDKSYLDYADLDLDDTTSYGPETTTIRQQLDGVYRFTVYDYTNGGSSSSYALANSSAIVKVYKGDTLVATYHVPTGQGGTVWTVFELDGDTITPINHMSYDLSDVNLSVNTLMMTITDSYDIELIRNLPLKEGAELTEPLKDEEAIEPEVIDESTEEDNLTDDGENPGVNIPNEND